MAAQKLEKIVIVGGGTAGWITASLLVRLLGKTLKILLIESEHIGTVGVGEATIPSIVTLNNALGLDEGEFLKATKGTIKLGIEFENWKQKGDCYMHAFGNIGKDLPLCSFHHLWNRGNKEGINSHFWEYSLTYQAAKQNRFSTSDKITPAGLQGLVYAYHFDASLYAQYLRQYSERLGVHRIEGTITQSNLESDTGFIESVNLSDGQIITGDLFIDCSGLRGLLIEQALNTGYEDWSHWLPCDRAVAVQCASEDSVIPYTRSIAHDAGWQWRIPLQHRVGNGLVYCSRYKSDDQAKELLLSNIEGKPLGEPKVIPFKTGRRIKQWHRNCVAIGLASGFLEPLESTSIHMIQSAVIRLIKHFPHTGIAQAEVDEYNHQSQAEFEHIRDFIILHYHLNQQNDSQFWRECQRMNIPESLSHKMQLFKTTGKIFPDHEGLFSEVAWQQVMIGQGIIPQDYHPLADSLSVEQLEEYLFNIQSIISGSVTALPSYGQFLKMICK